MRALLAVTASLLAVAAPALAQTPAPSRIFIASDSTAADYAPGRYPQMGWGMMLKCGLAPGVEIVNRARGGRSTRTFIAEGLWDALLKDVRAGDTVLIQFGHNDASVSRPERYAPAATAYRDNLLRMIWETRGKGAFPVLVTPPARRSFDGTRVKADFAEYSQVMRDLVFTTATPMIDLEARSRDWVGQAGVEGSRKYFLHYRPADKVAAFPEGIADDTHFSELGARGVANLVAQELKGLKVPVAEQVLAERPDLTRSRPLGSAACR
ncbi:rhamnogalacturonan acetylesterase [Sphingomonas sp. M1-B02]|uniref:rhamnogalacturonan acetylesterase n=1 Tax=Sphingomonas sp. M1-B02 TaxID=3114300 RepID=UPI0022402A0B|nr:rhamnogalacturonan acetylesterase [Sphingomonas sp. S6-11]UZK64678.1 rhamnogalacturonan acetylesterase [Sphingomonas sp. S6-11]